MLVGKTKICTQIETVNSAKFWCIIRKAVLQLIKIHVKI